MKGTSNRGGQMAGAEGVRVSDDVREVGSSKGGDVLGTRLGQLTGGEVFVPRRG